MTSQRMTGIVCTSLTSLVIVQYSFMGVFDVFTWFCVGVLAVFVGSIVWESVTMKLMQIATLFSIGGVLQFHGESSAYIGVAIIAITCYHCFGYGFLTTNPIPKGLLGGMALIVLLSLTPYGTIRTTVMRTAMATTMILLAWIPGRERVNKARAEAAIQTEHLEQVLKSTLAAAKVLADEITRRKTNGAE